MAAKKQKPISIALDDLVLELDPIVDLGTSHGGGVNYANSPFLPLHGRVLLPNGDVLTTMIRYEGGLRGIIDPVLQLDHEHFRLTNPFFERMNSPTYRRKVADEIDAALASGELKMRYDGVIRTRRDHAIYRLKKNAI